MVDFKGPALDKLPPDAKVTGVVEAADPTLGEIKEIVVHKNVADGTWRLSFYVRAAGAAPVPPAGPNEFPKLKPPPFKAPVEVRAFLKSGDDVLSETWNNRLDP